MRLNCESIEEVDCVRYMGSQVAADEGCEINVVQNMNENPRGIKGVGSAEVCVE